ncbi:MAG: hypothetical protein O3A51_13585 [Verrucomicrobia bacterium]|nr:hypothetical protein [Verrucomicrobiota bacterium]
MNWYAITRLMRDPGADPAEIKLTWAEDEFGREAAPVVLSVLDRVTEAARGALEFDALWTACHSRFPSLDYLDSHLCGPYRRVLRMEGLMGFVLPLDMYPPQRAADIRANPATRLVFNQVPITPTLKAEAMAQKEGAVRRMEEAIALWRSLNGKIDPGRHQNILVGLEGNRDDALIFRHMMDLYMDWKLGVLTETKIDAALTASRGRRGILVPDPLSETPQKFPGFDPASLKTFSEQLRRELNEPWIEKFWQDNPIGVGTLEPESDETVEQSSTIARP